ncbi:LolA family protein [Stenotrophomonas sp. LGBM10]|uniref:LolA family protein n=1 Tax=Stenotrophomonas sp. LGBM10 TaxID=3390038 RepID=UPI00398A770B
MSSPVLRLFPAALLALLVGGCDRTAEPPAPAPQLAAPVPAADPAGEVLAASRRFGQLRSFQARMQMQGPRPLEARMDFVAPDRYRLTTDEGEQTIIGDTFFLQRADEVRQVPVPPGLLAQWRNPLPPDLAPAQLQVEDLGSDRIDGRIAHKYRVRHATAAPDGMLYWIDAQGLPVRIQRQGQTQGQAFDITVSYARFDDPTLRVDLP